MFVQQRAAGPKEKTNRDKENEEILINRQQLQDFGSASSNICRELTSDKNNKASFKDRCNLIRELMLNLYSAMQNDEAVQFH